MKMGWLRYEDGRYSLGGNLYKEDVDGGLNSNTMYSGLFTKADGSIRGWAIHDSMLQLAPSFNRRFTDLNVS